MITGIQDIHYNVVDMDKSVDFYTTGLGMTLKHKDKVDRTNKVTFSNSIGRIQLERIVQNPVV